MSASRVEFSIEIEDVPAGNYPLRVGGNEVGTIEAFAMHDGEVYGRIRFRDPDTYGSEALDFEPRGQKIEVLQAGATILETVLPEQ
jgi:hypothetical protein